MFDPQDEYSQMHDDGDLSQEFARRCEREGIAYGGHEQTTAFVPKVEGADYSASHHRAELGRVHHPVHDGVRQPWLIAGSQLNDNQYNALQFLLDRFRREYGPGGTYDQFRTFLDDPVLKEELDEQGRVHEATFDAIKRRAYGFDGIFDQDARPITDLVDQFVRPGQLSCVPTYHVNNSRSKTTVVLALASMLVDEKLSNNPNFQRIKDLPSSSAWTRPTTSSPAPTTSRPARSSGKFTEAAKQGRKERLGLFLITQDPQDIADPVFKQINSHGRPQSRRRDAISAVNIPTNLESKVPYMEGPDGRLLARQLRARGDSGAVVPSDPARTRPERENRLPGPNVTVSRADVSISTTVK